MGCHRVCCLYSICPPFWGSAYKPPLLDHGIFQLTIAMTIFWWQPAQGALSVFVVVEMLPKLKSFQMFPKCNYFHSACIEFHGNRSLSLYLKFFTLLGLRKHFLCRGGGTVWNLLFLSLLPIILCKIPPFSFIKNSNSCFSTSTEVCKGSLGLWSSSSTNSYILSPHLGLEGVYLKYHHFPLFLMPTKKGKVWKRGKKTLFLIIGI